MLLLSFGFFLLLFIAIGVLSATQKKETSKDYLLAGSKTPAWLTALSAVATNNSGYMFIGQIGFTYMYGLHSIWLAVGWIVGDWLTSLFVHRKLREQTAEQKSLSFSNVLAKWGGRHAIWLQRLSAIIIFMFLGTYAAAQLNAGSKALHVLFGWEYGTGAIIGAVIVLIYCWAGGIRASIWTDAAQSFVMLLAMGLMLFIGLKEVGGITALISALDSVSPNYMDLFPAAQAGLSPFISSGLFIIGWLFAGIGVIGQPHIMVRFMAMDDAKNMNKARIYYYGFFSIFYALSIITALAARILLPDTTGFDAELALPTLAVDLLPEILSGLVLAGLFAATMSTADSQILSCTAAATHDLLPKKHQGYLVNKIATVLITGIALGIALIGPSSIFDLVIIAWSGLGSAFAPLLILMAFGARPAQITAITMMMTGPIVVLLWRYWGLSSITYEIFPAILSGFIVFFIAKAVNGLLQNDHKGA